MHLPISLSLLAGASLALANPARVKVVPRQEESDDQSDCARSIGSFMDTQPRVTGQAQEFLGSAFDEIIASLSTQMATVTATGSGVAEACSLDDALFAAWSSTTPPAALATEVSSFWEAFDSWIIAAQPTATSLAVQCASESERVGSMLFFVNTDDQACSTAVSISSGLLNAAVLTSAPVTTTTGTGGPGQTTTAPQTTATNNSQGGNGNANPAPTTTTSTSTGGAAAARETGFIAAAMAMAGVVGVVGLA